MIDKDYPASLSGIGKVCVYLTIECGAVMDLPDAYPLRDRGLPVDRDLSPVRLHMPSEANSDLERYGSLDAAVAIKRKAAQSLPASPGWNEEEETQRGPPPPQEAQSNVGLDIFSFSGVMSNRENLDEESLVTRHTTDRMSIDGHRSPSQVMQHMGHSNAQHRDVTRLLADDFKTDERTMMRSHYDQLTLGYDDDVSRQDRIHAMTDFERMRDDVPSGAVHSSAHTDRGYLSATIGSFLSPPTVRKLGVEGPQSLSNRTLLSDTRQMFSKSNTADVDVRHRDNDNVIRSHSLTTHDDVTHAHSFTATGSHTKDHALGRHSSLSSPASEVGHLDRTETSWLGHLTEHSTPT